MQGEHGSITDSGFRIVASSSPSVSICCKSLPSLHIRIMLSDSSVMPFPLNSLQLQLYGESSRISKVIWPLQVGYVSPKQRRQQLFSPIKILTDIASLQSYCCDIYAHTGSSPVPSNLNIIGFHSWQCKRADIATTGSLNKASTKHVTESINSRARLRLFHL